MTSDEKRRAGADLTETHAEGAQAERTDFGSTGGTWGTAVTIALFFVVALVSLLLDRVTKLIAMDQLADGRSVRVLGDLLGFKLLLNPGASLGMGSNSTAVFAILAMVACIGILVAVCFTGSKAWTVALALAFAGALGNLIDRIAFAQGFLDGRVVDFIDYGWSVGNVADIELVVAAVMIVLLICLDVPFGKGAASDGTPDGKDGEAADAVADADAPADADGDPSANGDAAAAMGGAKERRA